MRSLLLVLSTLLASSLACPTADAAPQDLKLTIHVPAENSHEYDNLVMFKDLVEAGAKGELKVSLYPGAVRFEAEQVPKAVSVGAIEMGATLLEHYDNLVPAVDIFINPFMFFNSEMLKAGIAAGSPVRAPLDDAILRATGSRVLWWMPAGAAVMLSKGAPIKTPADLAGKSAHTPGAVMGRFVQLCGGVPLATKLKTGKDAYKAGTAQVGLTDISDVESGNLWEIMDTLTVTRHEAEVYLVTINEKIWQSLTAAQKTVIQDAARAAERKLLADIDEIERKDFAHAEKMGMKVVEIGRAEVDQWKACALPLIGEFIGKSGKLGEQVVEGYRLLLEDLAKPPAERSFKR